MFRVTIRALVLVVWSVVLAGSSANAADPPLTSGITTVEKMIKVIDSKVPVGTPVAKARKFMEGQGFKCSVTKNGSWDKHEHVDYLYCTRSEKEAFLVDRRWIIALIYRDDKVVKIEANTGLVGP